MRQQILACEGELRTVSSPAYTAKDRDKALAEQSVSQVGPTNIYCSLLSFCLSSLTLSLSLNHFAFLFSVALLSL